MVNESVNERVEIPESLPRIVESMRCPLCAADLRLERAALHCTGCSTEFPIHDGIPRLAVHGSSESWSDKRGAQDSLDYQAQYQDLAEAEKYNEAYRDEPTKRWTTDREHRLLRRLLGGQPRCETLLNLPSGGGRLSGELQQFGELLVEADIGIGQLLYAKKQYGPGPERLWMTASGFHIPFKTDGVDATVCCRLNHHLPTSAERERLVTELLRVSRRFVLLTFFDYHSLKNLIRRARQPFNKKPPKMTMTVARVAEIAARNRARLVAWPALSHLSSGHRYALLVKEDA